MSKPFTFMVCADVFCVMRKSYFTNSYVVVTEDGLVAVDAGMKSNGSEMLSAIAELGRRPSEVRAILLTHWHNDHAAGASELARLSKSEVYYSRKEASHLDRSVAATGIRGHLSSLVPETGPLVLLKGLLGNAPQQAVEATRFVTDGEVIENDFLVLETPGHTVGHISYFYRPRGALFAGDALAVMAGKLRFMARPVTEDPESARRSMIRCLDLPINYICPGHREPLSENVYAECAKMRKHLENNGAWPLLG